MPTKKFDNIEELNEERKELDSKFESGLPEYLIDYFDEKEKKLLQQEFFKQKRLAKINIPQKEKYEYKKKEEEDFWQENETELVKVPRTVPDEFKFSFKEPERNTNDNERELTQEEISVLITLCEKDLYLFGIRYFPHYLKKPSSRLHKFLYTTISLELNKYPNGVKRVVAAPRAGAKCESGETNVLLWNGIVKKLKYLDVGDKVQSLDENLKFTTSKVIYKEHSGYKKCLKITTRSRKSIQVTPEHKVLTFDGWKEAGNLTLNDYIASPRRIKNNESNTEYLKDEEVKLLAYLIAEGALSSGNCSFSNVDSIIIDDFKRCCNILGFKYYKVLYQPTYKLSGGIRDWCRKFDILGHKAYTKRVPKPIFNSSIKQKRIFVAALFDTDGWASPNSHKIGITLANRSLIDDIYRLLLQLGITSRYYYKPNDKAGAWCLEVDKESLQKFSEDIPCLLKMEKIIKASEKEHNSFIDIYPNKVKKFYINVEREFRENKIARVDNTYEITRRKLRRMIIYKPIDEWIKLEEADVFWDRVLEIKEDDFLDTYDIEVENTNNFVGNGLVTHNSTIVSNITPLWCVCYNKKKFIIMLSDTLSQAEDFLYDIKQELELNEKIARDFPHVAGKGPVWRTNEVITNNGIKILALGTGNKIRGRRFGIHRPDLILGDDLENSEMVKSEVQRDYIRYEWFNKEVIFVGGEEGSSTDFFIVGTSIGKDALLNALLDPEQYPDWKGTRFAAVEQFHDPEVDHLWEKWKEIYKNRFDIDRKENSRKFFEEHKEEMLRGTRVLWPEGDPYYNLMEYKVSNPSGFETEKMNQPIDITKIYVTEEELHFEYFRGNKEVREAVNRAIERGLIFGALDPSLGKKSKKGDFSCIVTSARDPKSGYIFVIDISLRRRSVDEQILDILNFHQKYKYKKFAVETNAFQYVVAENLRKIGRQEGIYVPVEEIVNYQDKKMRVEGIVPFLKDGTIVFDKEKRKNDSMYARGIEQITSFTGENDAEDDCPDCLEMCFRIAQAPSFKMSHLPTKKDRR